jgi:hypothetical protein
VGAKFFTIGKLQVGVSTSLGRLVGTEGGRKWVSSTLVGGESLESTRILPP